MRRISSEWIWLHKKVFPVFWFGFLGIWCLFALPAVFLKLMPTFVLLVLIGMAGFGYVIMSYLIFPLVDEAWIDGDHIFVRKGKTEVRFPIADIINVDSSKLMNPEHITLTLKNQTELGSEIVFSPPHRAWPFGKHPVAQELLNCIHRLPD